MKLIARLLLASAMLSGSAALATVGTAFAAVPSHDTITVSCADGYSRTVSAHAAHGIAVSLTKFSRFTHSAVICTTAPGAPRPAPTAAKLTVSCTNGFERIVNARAANGQARALTNYNTHNHSGVTCTAA